MNNSKRPLLRISAALLITAIIAAAVILPILRHNQQDAKQSAADAGRLNVVAAENFWGNIAAQIGGGHVRVTSIISDPEADPHLYESSAANARAIADADVVITNGVGYDDFMDKLLGAANNNGRQVLQAAQILHVNADETNPHLWYDIPRVHEVSEAMAASFAAKDPAHKADYTANAKTFANSLQPLISRLEQIKQRYSGQSVAYTEPVAGYLLDAAGLNVASPAGFSWAIEEGNDPSPADTQTMNALFTDKKVKALLYNSQAVSEVTQKVQSAAKANGIPIIGVTETLLPQFKTYQTWQQSQLDDLQKAVARR